jgi:PAS domain S-box-containing protein
VATGVLESVEGVYRTGEPVSLREFEAAVGSGQEQTYWNVDHVPLWDNGSVDGVLILASEVTAEVQARQEAERLAARDQAILTSMTEGVVVFDLAGNVLSMNPAALRIHGFERLEEAQRHLLEFPDMFEIHDLEGRPVAVEQWPLARVLAGERFSGLEVQVRRTDTGQSWIGSYGGTPVLDKEARPFLGVLTLHDVTAQKRIEAAREQLLDELDTGRARLAAIIANAPEAIVVTDPSSRIVQANPASEHLFARPIEDGQRLGDSAGLSLYHPDGTPYQPEELPLSRSALDGETHADLEMLLYRPGGERRDLLVSTAPILDSQGRIDGVVGILQDITERRRTEEALRRYAERLQTLHSVDYAILTAESPEAIAKIALTHLRRAVPCMRASVALFDLKASEVFLLAAMAGGETPLAVGWRGPLTGEWPAEQLERGEICVVEDISTIQPPTPLYQTLLAEGVRSIVHLPLIAEGRLIGSLNLGMPTPGGPTPEEIETAREMAYGLSVSIRQSQLHAEVQRHADELEELVARRTAALQASQARLQAIYDSTSIGITLEDVEGRILDANPALQAMLGYDKGELQRMVFADFTHPEDVTISMEHFRELMAGKRQDYRLEKRYIRKDGQVIWANLTVSRTAGDEGEPQYAVGLVEDITERKLMQDALLNAEKLAIAGRMGASLAHEINNPLQSVIGCLGLAEKNLAEGGDASRYLGVARKELRRAARIVSQLRDMSRLSRAEKKVVVDVNALVDEVLVLSRKQAQEHGVEVVWEPAEDLPSVQADPDRIRQVFLNLTLNAFDAMPEGGQLRVSTARTGQSAGVRIAFADTGIGITSDALSKLFDPFYTTKSQGLGLGLYISHNIVEEHGGHIEATSRIGEGTMFAVWLPA